MDILQVVLQVILGITSLLLTLLILLKVVALFFGCRFSFSGTDLGKDSVNSAMGKATDIADNIKSEFKAN